MITRQKLFYLLARSMACFGMAGKQAMSSFTGTELGIIRSANSKDYDEVFNLSVKYKGCFSGRSLYKGYFTNTKVTFQVEAYL